GCNRCGSEFDVGAGIWPSKARKEEGGCFSWDHFKLDVKHGQVYILVYAHALLPPITPAPRGLGPARPPPPPAKPGPLGTALCSLAAPGALVPNRGRSQQPRASL